MGSPSPGLEQLKMIHAVVLLCVASLSLSSPLPQGGNTPNANGDYNFRFENSNQRERQARQESGFGAGNEVVEGSYSFDTPEGVQVAINYRADENGYFPSGAGIHPALARALEHLRRQNGI